MYQRKLYTEKVQTLKGKEFNLLNLPFYLTGQLPDYLEVLIGR